MEVEEQILAGGALLAVVSIFFPWFGGDWFGEQVVWNGLQFYTSVIGLLVLLSHLFVLAITILTPLGYPLFTQKRRDLLRCIGGGECILLLIVAISVFAKISIESPRVETRFGIYLSLVGSIVVTLYSFLRIQQHRRRAVEEIFHYAEAHEQRPQEEVSEEFPPSQEPQRVVGEFRIPREGQRTAQELPMKAPRMDPEKHRAIPPPAPTDLQRPPVSERAKKRPTLFQSDEYVEDPR